MQHARHCGYRTAHRRRASPAATGALENELYPAEMLGWGGSAVGLFLSDFGFEIWKVKGRPNPHACICLTPDGGLGVRRENWFGTKDIVYRSDGDHH